MPRPALGLIETSGIDGAIKATRAASDAGQVVIVSAEQGSSGRMTVKIEGEWSAVQGAVEAGARAAHAVGELVSMHVIPKSADEVTAILPYPRFVDRYRPDEALVPQKKAPAGKSRSQAVPQPKARPRPARAPKAPSQGKPSVPATEPKPAPAVQPISSPPQTATKVLSLEQPTWEQLQGMAVVKLRHYARTIPELPIKGRQISIANKEQLLEAIASVRPTRA